MPAATVYPGAIDTFDNPGATLAGAPLHSDLHKHLTSAVRAIEVALGINPAVLATDPSKCDARLTFTSGTPITTADVLAATNVYVSPFGGNKMALYDGSSAWVALTFAELTQSLAALVSGNNVDVFAYNNSGVVATELLAWTNATTRATALVRQDGILVKSGATTRRYLGTIYATATGQSADSGGGSGLAAFRCLWNYYNRRPRPMLAYESTASWTQATHVYRAVNSTAINRLNMVIGFQEDAVEAAVTATANTSAADYAYAAIGLDSTTTRVVGTEGRQIMQVAGDITTVAGTFHGFPGLGFHYLQQLEKNDYQTSTWYGAGVTNIQGVVMG